jgi:Fe-S cluster assembly iron-binding protein IscA
MLQVTQNAVNVLKDARERAGAPADAGVRIERTQAESDGSRPRQVLITLGFTNQPAPQDQTIEKDGMKVFVSSDLVEPLSERVLDVQTTDEGTQLMFR